jgi:uncharacterized protein YdaU (DUF1376 family)
LSSNPSRKGESGENELPTEEELGIYILLVFLLWAVEKRFTPSVTSYLKIPS